MKRLSLFLFLCIIFTSSCKKSDKIPDCINTKINEFKNTAIYEQGSNVEEYTFQNNLVYVFNQGNCGADFTSEVFDDNCNSLGYLGGITGNTIINGEDFSNANFEQIIWQN